MSGSGRHGFVSEMEMIERRWFVVIVLEVNKTDMVSIIYTESSAGDACHALCHDSE